MRLAAGRRLLVLGVIAALVVVTSLVAVVPRAEAVEDTSGSPTELEAVSASSATDAWAVGYRDFGSDAVTLHWDGRSWSTVPSTTASKLFGVSAISASDAWAVGSYSIPRSHTIQTLVLRWNGSAWSRVPSPNPSTFLNQLYGVSTVSPRDAWAVGYTLTRRHRFRALALHWDGVKWSTVPVPAGTGVKGGAGGGRELFAVSAASRTSAWAVGFGVLLHWNGVRWSNQSVSTRDFLESVGPSTLMGVSARSPTDAWVVGKRCAHFGQCVPRTEIIHWNGRRWSPVASPAPSRSANLLNGVSALSARNVWAVGAYCTSSSCAHERTLIVHWNGRRWSRSPSPNPSSSLDVLAGVAASSATRAWAVGASAGGSAGTNTLLLDWNGGLWTAS